MGGPAVELLPVGWVLQLLGSAAATAQSWEHASVSVEKVFCESLLVPVKHFISQYNQLHDISECQGYNTVSHCWVFVETLATIHAQEQTACLCGILWFHHHVHKNLIMDHILSQLKLSPTFISYFSLTNFNIILLPTPRTPTQ